MGEIGGRFGLEEPRRLLLASISSESSKRGVQLPPIQLPTFKLSLPGGSPRSAHPDSKTPRGAPSSTPTPRRKVPAPPDLGHAGAEAIRLAAVAAGVLLAGVSKAATHLTQHAKRPVELPFYQSFSFPWAHRGQKQSSRESEALARNLIARGREYERALDIRAAVQCFEEAVKLAPDNLESLCLAAKQWSDLTFYHDVRSDRERQLVNIKALEYAERAIAAHPDHCGGYMGACISKGRLALFCDNRTKVRLAKEAQEAARTALELGPEDDFAHHLMGRWHYEMAKINVVVRAVVRLMYGTALQPGTKEEALELYKKAIELAPRRLVHHTEAARVAMELGRTEEARASLMTALACDVEDINAWHTRMDAEMLLAQIENKPWRQPSMVPPGASAGKSTASMSTAALLGVSEAALAEMQRAASGPEPKK